MTLRSVVPTMLCSGRLFALLEQHGDVRPGWNHGRLEQALRRRIVGTEALLYAGDVDELKDAYALRIVADYDDRQVLSHEAHARGRAAYRFVAKIEGIISNATHP